MATKQFIAKILSTGEDLLGDKFSEECLQDMVECTQLPIPLTVNFVHRIGTITQLLAGKNKIVVWGTFDETLSNQVMKRLTGVYQFSMDNLEGFGPVVGICMKDDDPEQMAVYEVSLVPATHTVVPKNWIKVGDDV